MSLELIIRQAVEKRDLQLSASNRHLFLGFLQRQKKAHGYDVGDVVVQKALVDKLLLFSYLVGERDIISGYKGCTEVKRIKSVEDLYLLRPAEFGAGVGDERSKKKLTDRQLHTLFFRITKRKYEFREVYDFFTWAEHIDELGKDSYVSSYFGMSITRHTVRKCYSPNPLTFPSGGRKREG